MSPSLPWRERCVKQLCARRKDAVCYSVKKSQTPALTWSRFQSCSAIQFCLCSLAFCSVSAVSTVKILFTNAFKLEPLLSAKNQHHPCFLVIPCTIPVLVRSKKIQFCFHCLFSSGDWLKANFSKLFQTWGLMFNEYSPIYNYHTNIQLFYKIKKK